MLPRLFQPWLHGLRHRFLNGGRGLARSGAIFLLGGAVCLLIYFGSLKTLTYFHAQNELGVILSLKILQMAWITLFAMLVFSSMIAAVSTLYLSQDNEILLAAPVPPGEIYLLRFCTTTVSTSWMVLIFSLPLFGAYGRVFEAGPLFWPLLLFSVPLAAATASALALVLTIAIVYLFPARQTKDIVLYLSLCFGLFLYLIFRLMRPEDLVNPDRYGEFIEYFSAISGPAGPWFPAAWPAELLGRYLLDRQIDWLLAGLLATTPLVLYILGETAMEKLFVSGYSKSQESFGGHRRFRQSSFLRGPLRWLFGKELRQFTRDSSEWSQFFMIGALIFVYLYNFKALPLDRSPLPTPFIANLIAFANVGLCGFLAASLATRFVYPAVGGERGAFYLLASSPLPLWRIFLYKYLFYCIPFTLLTVLLITVSNRLLQISGPMWWISLYAALLFTWTVLALGLGLGAAFADFKAENRAAAMGPGAIIFLFAAVFYELTVLALGMRPAFRAVGGALRDGAIAGTDLALLLLWGGGTLLLSVAVATLALRYGLSRLRS